jgi:hypothetical protein
MPLGVWHVICKCNQRFVKPTSPGKGVSRACHCNSVTAD